MQPDDVDGPDDRMEQLVDLLDSTIRHFVAESFITIGATIGAVEVLKLQLCREWWNYENEEDEDDGEDEP